MLKKCLDCVKNIKLDKVAVFAGGVLFGTAGLKVLGSKDAKKVYTQGTAAVLRAKDCVMKTTNVVQENAEDILAEAKQINEKRYEKEIEAHSVRIAEVMKEHEHGILTTTKDKLLIDFVTRTTKRPSSDALKKKYPGVYADVLNISTSRKVKVSVQPI